MTLKPPSSHSDIAFNYSLVHLKRGIFMSSGSDNKLKIWLPGRGQKPNYLGQLEEDHPTSNLTVFGSHLKSKDELSVVYSCGPYIKLLSFKTLTSMIVYKNLKEITSICIVQQNPNIISFGTISGAIKEFDVKTKKLVRSEASMHKSAITAMCSAGKYLISLSSKDNLIVVYNYQSQAEHCSVSLSPILTDYATVEKEFPTSLTCFSDVLLIGTNNGKVLVYDLNEKCFIRGSLV